MYQPLSQTNLVFTCPCFPELSIQTEVLSLPQQQDRIAEVLWSTRKVIYPNIWKNYAVLDFKGVSQFTNRSIHGCSWPLQFDQNEGMT